MILRVALFLIAISVLAVVQFVATTNFLYWRYSWLDMPMHFLGGLCVALGFAILPFFRVTLPPQYRTLVPYLVFVFLVGIAWEVFEYANGISLASVHERLFTDTLMDLILDLFGGYLGFVISKHTSEVYELN
jgi:uncharacterized membrane protein YoaK (UPF0700 family)